MQKTSERLGKLVKETRISRNLTQLELAELLDKSERTVIKIEKGEGNPKLDSLAQIVKVLKPDLEVLFDPDHARERPQHDALCREIADCTEDEAAALIPVVQSFLFALSQLHRFSGELALRHASGSLLNVIFSCITSIRVSFLHLGQ